MIKPTEYQIKDNIGSSKTDEQKVSDSSFENLISKDIFKNMALNKLTSLDKSRYSSKNETEDTVKLDTKKDQCHQPVQMIKI